MPTDSTKTRSETVSEIVLPALALLVFVLFAYSPAAGAGFIWDDDKYVTENPMLTAPDGLKQIWFSAHTQSQYFPLVFTTFRWERLHSPRRPGSDLVAPARAIFPNQGCPNPPLRGSRPREARIARSPATEGELPRGRRAALPAFA